MMPVQQACIYTHNKHIPANLFLSQGCEVFILQVPGFLIKNLIISGDDPKTSDAVPNNSKLPNAWKHNLVSSTFPSKNQKLY